MNKRVKNENNEVKKIELLIQKQFISEKVGID